MPDSQQLFKKKARVAPRDRSGAPAADGLPALARSAILLWKPMKMKAAVFSILSLSLLLLLTVTSDARASNLAELREEIEAILGRPAVSGNSWSIYIENEYQTTFYFSESPTTTKRPASVTKLFTTAAAFARLGPSYRFQTRIHHTGTVSGGVLAGDLHLVAEHDFTWSTDHYSNARTPLNQIAAALHSQGLRHVEGGIVGSGVGIYNRSVSNALVADQFRQALIAAGITVTGGFSGVTGFASPGPLLLTWQSMRLDQACLPINRQSVNVYADLLLRHLGWKLAGSDTASGGEGQVRQWLASTGIDTAGFQMRDGSGLLWSNTGYDTRISAVQSLELLRYMRNHFPTFETTLTVACRFGTLGSRLCGSETAGNVFGKTGTLTNGQTTSLAGYVKNPSDGEVYYFAFIANGVTDVTATRRAIDDCVRLLAQPNLPNDGPLPPYILVLDQLDPAVSFTGPWTAGQLMGGYRYNYHWASGTAGEPTATATFRPRLPITGFYNVYVWYLQGGNRSPAAEHRIIHQDGSTTVTVDQRTGGSEWRLLGEELLFAEGTEGSVVITNGGSPTGVILADAVRFELVRVAPEPVFSSPLLHYLFHEVDGSVPDYGVLPKANGNFREGALRVDAAPSGGPGRAFATTSARGHLSAGSAPKLDALERFTLTTWINLRAAPAHANRILSRQGSGTFPGFSWAINHPNSGSLSADNFTTNLTIGGENGLVTRVATADLSADREWIFLAVTYDSTASSDHAAFYHGSGVQPVVPTGDRQNLAAGRVNPTTFSFLVAETAATATNTAPEAWFDDVRVYDVPLTRSQLETVRLENLAPGPRRFEQWQREHFTIAQLEDPEISSPDADPGGTNLPNLLRYAFGLTPDAPGLDRLPEAGIKTASGNGDDQPYLTIVFRRSLLSTDLEYTVLASGDLHEWEATPVLVSADLNEDGTVTERFRDTLPVVAGERRFLRLRVSRPLE